MKKITIILVLLCSITFTAKSQNWLNTVKKVATEAVDNATNGKLTAAAIVGTWNYSAPALRLESDNALANVGGSVVGSTLSTKLDAVFEKVGIKDGFCSITLNGDKSFSMPIKTKTLKGTYEYDASTHAIKLSIGNLGIGALTGYAYISGSNLQLVFPTGKLMELLTSLGAKVASLSTITSMLKQYENAYIGFEFVNATSAE